jgi:putative transcriptional regulator
MWYYLINTQLVGRRKIMNNKLVKLRGTRTQEEIANAIGISISAIGMYETGQRVPRDEIKVKLANFYNVSIESLFFDNNVHSEKTRTK